jgi:hypothetical protein
MKCQIRNDVSLHQTNYSYVISFNVAEGPNLYGKNDRRWFLGLYNNQSDKVNEKHREKSI